MRFLLLIFVLYRAFTFNVGRFCLRHALYFVLTWSI